MRNLVLSSILCTLLGGCHLVRVQSSARPAQPGAQPAARSTTAPGHAGPTQRPARASRSEVTYEWRRFEDEHRQLAADIMIVGSFTKTAPRVEATELAALERYAAATAQLDDLAARCKVEPLASARAGSGGRWEPGDYCAVALEHRARLEAAVAAMAHVAQRSAVSRAEQALGKDETVDMRTIAAALFPDDRVHKMVERVYKAVGKPAPPDATAKLAEATRALDDKLRAVAAKHPADAGAQHAEAARGARGVFAAAPIQNKPKLALARVWLTDSAWRTDFDGRGNIVGRFKNVAALVTVTGKSYCFRTTGVMEQDYAGGRYAASSKTNIAMVATVVGCR